MRSPFRSFTHWITGTVLSLLVIITILLGYNFLSAEYAKFEALEQEQSVLHKVKNDLEGVRDKFAKALPARIPQPGTPLNLMARSHQGAGVGDQRQAGDPPESSGTITRSSASCRSATRSERFRPSISRSHSCNKSVANARNLHSFGAGPLEAERQIKWFQTGSNKLGEQIYQNKKTQWELSNRERLMWQVPFTAAYREMKRLEAEERSLQNSKDQHDAEIARQQAILQALQKLPLPGPLVLDHAAADRAIQPVNDRLAENDKQLEGSSLRKFMRPVKEVLPAALWILGLALLSPLLVKAIAYYLIAPIAARRPPVRLLPASSGKLSTSIGNTGNESGPTTPSRVSLPLSVDERSELLILPSYLQGMPLNAKSDTRWLLELLHAADQPYCRNISPDPHSPEQRRAHNRVVINRPARRILAARCSGRVSTGPATSFSGRHHPDSRRAVEGHPPLAIR